MNSTIITRKSIISRFFSEQRQKVLSDLQANRNDKSLAGCVDSGILDLVNMINSYPHFFTTSSCSGRVSVFHQTEKNNTNNNTMQNKKMKKKRGNEGLGFLFSSHDKISNHFQTAREIYDRVSQDPACQTGTVALLFEPVILHVRAENIACAQNLLECASVAGLRRSGLIAPSVSVPLRQGEGKALLRRSQKDQEQEEEGEENENENEARNDYEQQQEELEQDENRPTIIINQDGGQKSSNLKSNNKNNNIMTSLKARNYSVQIGSNLSWSNLLKADGEFLMSEPESVERFLKITDKMFDENERRKQLLSDAIIKRC